MIIEKQATPYKIIIDIDNKTLNEQVDLFWEEIKDQINLQGFRKGNVPQKIAEEKIGFKELYKDWIPKYYTELLVKENIEVLCSLDYQVLGDFSRKGKLKIENTVYFPPTVELGKYEDVKIDDIPDINVTDDEVELQLKNTLKSHSTKQELDVVEDDSVVVIDYEGFIDGEKFKGGSSKNFSLKIGSKTFIDTFETQLIGCKKGITEVNVTFPENYKDLSNKKALFKVKIKSIFKEIPQTIEEFASDHNTTVEDVKEKIINKLLEFKQKKTEDYRIAKTLDSFVKLCKISPIPEICIEQELDNKFKQYLDAIGKQEHELEEVEKIKHILNVQQRQKIIDGINASMVVREIAKVEGLEVSKEEIEYELGEKYKNKQIVDLNMNSQVKRDLVETSLLNKKGLNFLMEKVS